MRVVAGAARGRPLRAPAGGATRPTSDRVREALFNMLTSMDVVEDAAVVDLFAGSGALGIEALSRGAARAVLVDADRAATDAITANLGALGDLAPRAEVVRADAVRWARRQAATRAAPFDLVLADPPYAWDDWDALLAPLEHLVGVLVAETGSRWDPGPAWETVKARHYGSTVVTIVRPQTRGGK
jgi:16S rRNA (guanine966-N2)-methyltransferase